MYLDLIPRQNKISEHQFLGDLTSLFARHRIEVGDARSFDHFYSRLASNDAFRGRLFSLCTAISHMSDEDLSGEQLLGLISRALTGSYGLEGNGNVKLPEGLRSEFIKGYQAWGARDPNALPPAPPPRQQMRRDEPLSREEAADARSEIASPEVRAPGMRTTQEAIGLTRRQSSGEEAGRGGAAGKSIEGLTLQELTRLLEDIEQRMRRIRPPVIAAIPAVDFKAPLSQPSVRSPAELPPVLSVPPIEVFEDSGDLHARESAFLQRHAYLRPKQPGAHRIPETELVAQPALVVSPPVTTPRASVHEDELLLLNRKMATYPTDKEYEYAVATPLFDASSDRLRVKIYLAIGVLAAIVFVASPIAGVVVYHFLHPGPKYIYRQEFSPPIPTIVDTIPAPTPNAEEPIKPPAVSVMGKPNPAHAGASRPKLIQSGRNPPTTKRAPPVSVWPPAPQ